MTLSIAWCLGNLIPDSLSVLLRCEDGLHLGPVVVIRGFPRGRSAGIVHLKRLRLRASVLTDQPARRSGRADRVRQYDVRKSQEEP